MNILLASTVMVVAAASLLVAFTLRTWSRTYQAGFNDMRRRILDHEKHILEVEERISAAQAILDDLGDTVEAQGKPKRDTL
jgi:hypothetical protein